MEYHNLQTPQPQQPQWGYGWAPPPPAQPPANDYNTKNHTNDYNSKTHSNDYNSKSHTNDYNSKGHSNEYNNKGHSNEYNNKGHSNEYNNKGHTNDYNSKGHSNEYNNKGHSNDYNSKNHSNKRAHSDSDDDAFSDDHSSKDATSTGGESCHLLTRKRRRGVIEKKRRDRINTSLTELKRLVPAACEKQGSAKLEKAEILQLTVDHLKMLHAKGLDTFAYDPQRYAMDYHSIGFRECAAEVARYLVSCEGLDIQDPLRLRLMSHLQCFAAQRELAAKSANWGYPQYPSTPQHGYSEIRQDPATSTATTTIAAPTAIAAPLSAAPSYPHYPPAPPAPPGPHPAPPAPHYPAPYPHHPTHHQYSQNSSKPYRPWGAELAY